MKVLYIGCVKSSFVFLDAIVKNTTAEIVGVVTKIQSNYNADHYSLHNYCNENSIDWIDYKDTNQLLDWVEEKQPDIIYCFGWSYLIPKEIYSIAKMGAVGYHPTLLPKNRGRHPIIWTIVLGLEETGSTFFYLGEEADSGAILSQQKIGLEQDETANTLYEKLMAVGKIQVIEMTNALIANDIVPIEQDELKATYLRKRTKEDGKIEWKMCAKKIQNLINALTRPYRGAHFEFNDCEIIVWNSRVIEGHECNLSQPGEIIKVSKNSFIVKTGDECLEILEFEGDFQPEKGYHLYTFK